VQVFLYDLTHLLKGWGTAICVEGCGWGHQCR